MNDYTRAHDFRGAILVLDHLGETDHPFQVLSGASVNGASFLDLRLLGQLQSGT